MTHPNRRQLLRSAGAGLAALALSPLYALGRTTAAAAPDGFTLPDLPYPYEALEPSIDKETMHIHHDKHHAAYVKNLNDALKDQPDFLKMDVVDVLKNVSKLPKDIQQKVINNGGGHLNHSLFWRGWRQGQGRRRRTDRRPRQGHRRGLRRLRQVQGQDEGGAIGRFGSGWAWLVFKDGKLDVVSSRQPGHALITSGAAPLLGVDVWEHAYYLKYHQDRGKYVDAWWDVVNWKTPPTATRMR